MYDTEVSDASLLIGQLRVLFTGDRTWCRSAGDRWLVVTSLEYGSERDVSFTSVDGVTTAFVSNKTIASLFPMLSSEIGQGILVQRH